MDNDNRTERDVPVTMGDTKSLKTTATGQLAHLSDLDDVRIVEGEPDIRGWSVRGTDGQSVGKVEDLLVDTASMKVRYIEVRLEKAIAKDIGRPADLKSTPISEMAADARSLPHDDDRSNDVRSNDEAGRYVLVPIGIVRLDDDADDVLLDAEASQMIGIPAYDRKALTRDHESDVLSRFNRGDSKSHETSGMTAGSGIGGATGAGIGAGIAGTSAGSGGLGTSDVMNAARPSDAQSNVNDDFYSDRNFDDRSFLTSRGRNRDDDAYFTRADRDERARARQSGVDRDVNLTGDDIDTNSSTRDLTR